MKMELFTNSYNDKWKFPLNRDLDSMRTLIVVFGSSDVDKITKPLQELSDTYTKATIIGASTAGEIIQDELLEGVLVISVMKFSSTRIDFVAQAVMHPEASYESAVSLTKRLKNDHLKSIFVLSDGLHVNGSQVTKGMNATLSKHVVITGGLAADNGRFKETWVLVDGEPKSHYITAVGLYGDSIHVGHASRGGWDKLGISRKVTRSHDNILYALDGQPALDIYRRYLGDKADGLPATGLLFPLELLEEGSEKEHTVRTILAINETDHSITFAGDIPEGSTVTLMKANFDRLIDGASRAAESVDLDPYKGEPLLSIAISCVGRRLVLKQRTEDELEAVLENLPEGTKQIGFYSYGEISPLRSGHCDLHNQTMTLTLIWESDA